MGATVLSEIAKKFLADAEKYGVSETRLKKMQENPIEVNSLPTDRPFKIIDYTFSGAISEALDDDGNPAKDETTGENIMNDYQHARFVIADLKGNLTGDSISFSNIRLVGLQEKTAVHFRRTAKNSKLKGGFVLTGGKPVNPSLIRSDVALVEKLLGKTCTAEETEVRILPFKRNGWQVMPNPDTDIISKAGYKLTIVDSE